MKLVKTLVAAAALTAASFTAQASMINVGGITWDPNAANDFTGTSSTIRQFIDNDGTLRGYGILNSFNGLANTVFANMGGGNFGELTFEFGGFKPTSTVQVPTLPSQTISYNMGWIRIYADFTNDPSLRVSNPLDAASLNQDNTTNGQLFLALKGYNDIFGNTFYGYTSAAGGTGLGQLEVDYSVQGGGLAASNFDTNTRDDFFFGTFKGADIVLSTNFFLKNPQLGYKQMDGGGSFYGDSIPEPSSLAVLGLGLLGLTGVARRKQAK